MCGDNSRLAEPPEVLEIKPGVVGDQTADYTLEGSAWLFIEIWRAVNSLQGIAGLLERDSCNVDIKKPITGPNLQCSFQGNETPRVSFAPGLHLINFVSLARSLV